MDQATNQGKPADWILLGTLVHAVLKAGDQIQHADNPENRAHIAAALGDFARDIGEISGIAYGEKDGMTTITRGKRTAILGENNASEGEPAANDDLETGGSFGGPINDPMGLGKEFGGFLAQVMDHSSALPQVEDRMEWLDRLVIGIATGLRPELPYLLLAATFAGCATEIIGAEVIASQASGRAEFGLRRMTPADIVRDLDLTKFVTDSTPDDVRAILEWHARAKDVMEVLASYVNPDEVQTVETRAHGNTRH